MRPAPLTLATHVADVRSPRARAVPPSPPSPLPGGAWLPLGPAPLGPATLGGGGFYGGVNSGRVTGLAYIPSGPHAGRVVAGTAGGGIWTTDNNGSVWTARSDFAPSLAIGSVAVDPSHPEHLIAGTGEANQSGDSYPGFGILSSTNGGTTWSTQNPGGVFNGLKIAQVAIDPTNSSHMFAATSGGLFVTTNGGTTWAKPTDPSYASVDGSITAVVINPVTPATVFIGGGPAQVAKSTDGGVHWAPANTGVAASGSFALTALAIANSTPSTMYLSIGSLSNPAAAYKSTDGGTTWNALTTPDYTGGGYAYGGGGPGDQGWYDNVVAVSPTNANLVLLGGIAEIASTDGGTTWTNINGQSFFGGGTNLIHPDQHAIAFGAGGNIWTGADGGVYLYNPSGPTVTNKNGNLNITQFYFGFNEVGGTVLAGSQDNSSGRTSSSHLGPWTEIWDGDGGPSFITPNHPATQFIEADSGLYRSNDAFVSDLTNITPLGGVPSLFTPPIAVIPSTTTPSDPTVFFGGTDLWRTTNPSVASPTWTTVTSVGTSVSAIAISPSNPNVVYVGFTDGTVQVSTDRGLTFTSLATQPFSETFVTGLSVNPSNPKAITLSVSNSDTRSYASFPHVAQYAYTSAPGTGTWTDITGNLPSFAVSRVVYDHGALLAATDIGVYGAGSIAGGATSWSRVGTALPRVQAQDLFVDPKNQDVYVITHGRGAWRLHYATSISSVSPKAGPLHGGQKVTISGIDLAGATKVTFGTKTGTHLKVVSASTITVTTPAHAAGTVDVRVTGPAGKSAVTPADHYTYENPPTVTSVSPAKGAHVGGNVITISGKNFVGATKVVFGTTAGTKVTVVSSTKLTVKVPAHARGTVDVRVTTPSGTSPKVAKDHYKFT